MWRAAPPVGFEYKLYALCEIMFAGNFIYRNKKGEHCKYNVLNGKGKIKTIDLFKYQTRKILLLKTYEENCQGNMT